MKTGTLLATGVVVAAALAGALYLAGGRSSPAKADLGLLCPDLAAKGDAATRIVIRKAKSDTIIEQREGRWVVASKGGYPAERATVITLVRSLAGSKLLEERTTKPDLYARLRVEDPDAENAASTLVRVEDAAGVSLANVIVGNSAPASDGLAFFARRAGEERSYLASGSVSAPPEAISWINTTFAELRNERVRSATVKHADGPIHIHRDRPADQTLILDNTPEGRALRDEYTLTRLAWALSHITLDDVAPAADIPLGETPLVTEIRCFDGLLVTIRQVQKDGATWITLAASFEPPPAPPATEGEPPAAQVTEPSKELADEIVKLNEAWSPWAFKVPEYKATVLRSVMEDFLRPLAPPAPPPTPPG